MRKQNQRSMVVRRMPVAHAEAQPAQLYGGAGEPLERDEPVAEAQPAQAAQLDGGAGETLETQFDLALRSRDVGAIAEEGES